MEEKNKKVVHIMEIDDVPYLNWSTAKLIEERNLVFEWGGQFFKVRRVSVNKWDVCRDCQLDCICDREVERICKAFDDNLGGCHMLKLAEYHV